MELKDPKTETATNTAFNAPKRGYKVTEKVKRLKRVMAKSDGNQSMRSMMLEAGYAPSYADNPQKLTATPAFQAIISPVIVNMEKARDLAVSAMIAKTDKASYGELARGVDVLSKNVELLSGRATQRSESAVAHLSTEELIKLLQGKD